MRYFVKSLGFANLSFLEVIDNLSNVDISNLKFQGNKVFMLS